MNFFPFTYGYHVARTILWKSSPRLAHWLILRATGWLVVKRQFIWIRAAISHNALGAVTVIFAVRC